MNLRYDGFYRSNVIHHENLEAGAKKREDYFEYIRFFDDGFYVSKKASSASFDFPQFLAAVDLASAKRRYPGSDPIDRDNRPVYRMGRFEIIRDRLSLTFGQWVKEGPGKRWMERKRELRIESAELLAMGRAIKFGFVEEAPAK